MRSDLVVEREVGGDLFGELLRLFDLPMVEVPILARAGDVLGDAVGLEAWWRVRMCLSRMPPRCRQDASSRASTPEYGSVVSPLRTLDCAALVRIGKTADVGPTRLHGAAASGRVRDGTSPRPILASPLTGGVMMPLTVQHIPAADRNG